MPLDMNNEIDRDTVNATRTTGLILGPCVMCEKQLRKLSHCGPWVRDSMHVKCWKAREKEKADQEYLLSKQKRAELFQRAVDGDATLEVPEWMKTLRAPFQYNLMRNPDAKIDTDDIHTAFWSWHKH